MKFSEVKQTALEVRHQYRFGVLTIGALILAVIFVVIGLALAPTIANSSAALTNTTANPNVTTAGAALFGLVPVVYAAVLIVAVLAAFGLGQ